MNSRKTITFRHPLIPDTRIDQRTRKRSGKGKSICRGLAGAADPLQTESDLRRLLDDAPASWAEAVEKVPDCCRDAFRLYFEPVRGIKWEREWESYSNDNGSGRIDEFRRRLKVVQRRFASLEKALLMYWQELERLEAGLLYKGAKNFDQRMRIMRLGDLPKALRREVQQLHRDMGCIGNALAEVADSRAGGRGFVNYEAPWVPRARA